MDNPTVRSFANQGFKMISRSAVPACAPPASAPKPKLLDQVRQAIRSRHLSYNTEQAYVGWIKRFIFFHDKRHPKEMGELEIGQFLSSLATDAHVAASTQNQALNALLFLYNEVLAQKVGFIQGVVRAKETQQIARCAYQRGSAKSAPPYQWDTLVDGDAIVRGRIAAHGVLSS